MANKFVEKKQSKYRNQAENMTKRRFEKDTNVESMNSFEIHRLIHELHVHQIELELQNEELLKTHLELMESRDKYAELFDFAPVGYFTFDENAEIIEVNLAGSTLTGIERNKLISKNFRQFIFREDQDIFYLFWKRLFETKDPQSCEIRLIRGDGTVIDVKVGCELIENRTGKIARCRGIVSDISARKFNERERKELLEKTQEVSALKSDIILWVSHELKTPLVPILGWTAFILAQVEKGRPLENIVDLDLIKTLWRNAKRLERLVNQFLDIGRIEKDRFKLEPVEMDVGKLLSEAIQSVDFMREEKNITIECLGEKCSLFIDPMRLELVFINILTNAIKYSPENTTIRVEMNTEVDPKGFSTFKIAFIDQGFGFTTEEIKQVAVPFEQLNFNNPQKKRISSTGVGIYISKIIMEKHGGTLSIESSGLDKGSTVTVSLPI